MLGTILIVLLILALLGAIPTAGSYNASWGAAPAGGLGLVLVIILILVIVGGI